MGSKIFCAGGSFYAEFEGQREKFLSGLKGNSSIQNWQVIRADESLDMYFNGFLKFSGNWVETVSQKNVDCDDWSVVLQELHQVIRVKGLSLNTMKVYKGWVTKFQKFVHGTPPGSLNSQDAKKKFINHLAFKKNVSSSTQNRAYNALLFFYKNTSTVSAKGF